MGISLNTATRTEKALERIADALEELVKCEKHNQS